jgi:hypothetical protein
VQTGAEFDRLSTQTFSLDDDDGDGECVYWCDANVYMVRVSVGPRRRVSNGSGRREDD